MSTYTKELPKEIATAWRKFLGTNEGQFGLDWLRRNHRRVSGETDAQLVKSAGKWEGYMEALDDIEDHLTELPSKAQSLDEPLLETADPRT